MKNKAQKETSKQNNSMNVIATLLETTQDDYETMIIQHYTYWCGLFVSSEKTLQKFVYNQHLFNWYQLQIKDLELIFYDKAGGSKLTTSQIRALYFDTLSKVGEYYPPRHIFQKIRKQCNTTTKETTNYNLN